jgi:predicted metalloendopeptidase
MRFTQLQQLAPGVDWSAYFAAAELPRVDLNVAEPNHLRRLDVELRETPLPVWKVYLRWRLLDSASPFLSKPFVDATGETRPRAQRCLESTEGMFGDALGRKYVGGISARRQGEGSRDRSNLLAVLKDDVAALEWMRPETRKTALEKLDAFDAQVGYPDRWKDYGSVEVRRDAFWANVVAGRRFNVDENRRGIGKPTERDLWQLPPSSPDAYIDLQLNQMVLPAGFLRPPAFGLEQAMPRTTARSARASRTT